MNGYQPDFSGGYPPTGMPNNFKTSHPYNSYIDSYSNPARQQHMQMNGHIEYGGQRMNTNPNQYIQSQQQYSPMQHRQDTGSPSGGFNALGYNRRVQQQPPQQQIYQRPYTTNNYSSQQVSYANIAGQYIPSQPSIPVQSSQPTTKLVNTTNIDGNPLANLKMTLAEEKKQQEKSQEDYASRFLAAVQERVQNHVTSGNNIQIQQQYENYYEQSPEMYEFEASHQSTEQFQPSPELLERIEQSSNKQIIFEVQIGLEQLCAEPSEYEAWSLAIREALNRKEVSKVEDYEVVSWLICEMAIYSPNCQANFAKLSCYLMDYVQGFTDAFMPMFTYYHDARSVLLIEQVEHLLLFTAEIYERKLTITRSRTAQVAVMLIDQLRNIMSRPLTDHVIKTIVDVMKLSGYHLEQDTYKDAVDDIMKDLNTCTSDGKRAEGLTDTGAGYITMLMIHRNEWGKQQQNLPTKTENNPMDLTDEELGFLEKHNAINPAIVHNGSSSGELDDEILEDYEKFLRDHAEQTALASVEKIFEKLSVDEEDEDVTEEVRNFIETDFIP